VKVPEAEWFWAETEDSKHVNSAKRLVAIMLM
jgi:hypothetical protein